MDELDTYERSDAKTAGPRHSCRSTSGRVGPGYTIAAVSKLTGISCHALRIWERRHALPTPMRSASGHRRYSAEQVAQVLSVAERLRAGVPLREAIREARAVGSGPPEAEEAPAEVLSPAGLEGLFQCLGAGDVDEAERRYRELVAGLDRRARVLDVLAPAMVESGERWFRGEFEVCQERFSSMFLRAKVVELLEACRIGNPSPRRRVLLATPAGDLHEGGPLLASTLLEMAGWRSLNLGTNVPVEELQRAIDRWRPDALGISLVLSRNVTKRFAELGGLKGAPIFVGGRSLVNYAGLARRHGLFPLPGRGEEAVEALIGAVEG